MMSNAILYIEIRVLRIEVKDFETQSLNEVIDPIEILQTCLPFATGELNFIEVLAGEPGQNTHDSNFICRFFMFNLVD